MHSAKCIAVIGAGGKTTTLSKLADLHRAERVLLTTTTHIFPFSHRCATGCVSHRPQRKSRKRLRSRVSSVLGFRPKMGN